MTALADAPLTADEQALMDRLAALGELSPKPGSTTAEKKAGYVRAWRARNLDRVRANGRATHARHREHAIEHKRAYYAKNRDAINAKKRAKRAAEKLGERA